MTRLISNPTLKKVFQYLSTLFVSGDYGYGGFGEDQYSDYYSTYENYSSSRGSLPGEKYLFYGIFRNVLLAHVVKNLSWGHNNRYANLGRPY